MNMGKFGRWVQIYILVLRTRGRFESGTMFTTLSVSNSVIVKVVYKSLRGMTVLYKCQINLRSIRIHSGKASRLIYRKFVMVVHVTINKN